MAKKKKKAKRVAAPRKPAKKAKAKSVAKRKAKKKVAKAAPSAKPVLDGFLIVKPPTSSFVLRASFDGGVEFGEFPLGDAHTFEAKGEAKAYLAKELARETADGAENLFVGAEVAPVKQVYTASYDVLTDGKDPRITSRIVRVGDSPVTLAQAIKAHVAEYKRQVQAARDVLKAAEAARIAADAVEAEADNDLFKATGRLESFQDWAKYDARG